VLIADLQENAIKRLIAKAMADFHLEPIAPEEEALDGQL
jgi:hypothetical protein